MSCLQATHTRTRSNTRPWQEAKFRGQHTNTAHFGTTQEVSRTGTRLIVYQQERGQQEQKHGWNTQHLMRSCETEKHSGGWLLLSASWDLGGIAVDVDIFGVSNQFNEAGFLQFIDCQEHIFAKQYFINSYFII